MSGEDETNAEGECDIRSGGSGLLWDGEDGVLSTSGIFSQTSSDDVLEISGFLFPEVV